MKKAKSEPVKTILVISIGFTIIFLITKAKWAISISVIVGLAGLASGYISKQIDFLWMKLSHLLSLIVPNIILGAFYYLFLVPISFLSKIFRKEDPFIISNTFPSTYKNVNKSFSPASFEKPW